MIKNTFYIALLLLISGCSSGKGEFELKGSVDLKDGDMVYRIVADSNQQPKVIDSVAVKAGSFTMIGESPSPDVNFLSLQGLNGNFPFILESGTLKVSLYKDSLIASKAYGTVSNDDFMKYKAETKVFISSIFLCLTFASSTGFPLSKKPISSSLSLLKEILISILSSVFSIPL